MVLFFPFNSSYRLLILGGIVLEVTYFDIIRLVVFPTTMDIGVKRLQGLTSNNAGKRLQAFYASLYTNYVTHPMFQRLDCRSLVL